MASAPLLFTPVTLRGVTARNRLVVSPMCQYVSVDGSPTDWQFVHFGRYAMGGAGIVFGEETAVEARGRKTYDKRHAIAERDAARDIDRVTARSRRGE